MSKIPKLRILSILAVAAALAALIAVPVFAQPPVTSPLSGSVTIDGSNAPVGTTIEVFVGTETTARATFTTTTAGYYELVVLGGSADVGKALSFKVNTVTATSSPASPTFLSYQPQVVNLSVTTGPTYTLTVSVSPAGKGSVTKNPNLAQYPAGTVVTLTAYAAAGWDFDEWSGTNNNNINPTTVTMNANKSVTAYFEEEEGPPPESFAWWLYETFVECLVD